MDRYKLFIHAYNDLERSLLRRHRRLTPEGHRIVKEAPLVKSIEWRVYNIDTEDVLENKFIHYGGAVHYSARLLNKLFINKKNVMSEQCKDVIHELGNGPFEVRYWQIIYNVVDESSCRLRIVFRNLNDGNHKYHEVYGRNTVRAHINLMKPFILYEINSMELFAIMRLSVSLDWDSITKEEFERYRDMSREEAIEELAMEYISLL